MADFAKIIRRAQVTASNASPKMQIAQVQSGADRVSKRTGKTRKAPVDDTEHFEPYGFTSKPLPGAEALTVAVDGASDHLVTITVADRRYRLKDLGAGDVALYDDKGNTIELRSTGIVIKSVASIKLGATATLGVARETDAVDVTIPAMTVVVNVVAGVPTFNPLPITLTGTITAASATVKAD